MKIDVELTPKRGRGIKGFIPLSMQRIRGVCMGNDTPLLAAG